MDESLRGNAQPRDLIMARPPGSSPLRLKMGHPTADACADLLNPLKPLPMNYLDPNDDRRHPSRLRRADGIHLDPRRKTIANWRPWNASVQASSR
jgi:hypothetical protein